MKRRNLRWPMNWLLAAVMLTAWGCAPAAAPGAAVSGPATAAGTYQEESMPASAPDPVPDPVAGQTAVSGEHLDVIGTISALDDSGLTMNGIIYSVTAATEVKGTLAAGARAKLEYIINADGSRTVIEAKSSEFFDE